MDFPFPGTYFQVPCCISRVYICTPAMVNKTKVSNLHPNRFKAPLEDHCAPVHIAKWYMTGESKKPLSLVFAYYY